MKRIISTLLAIILVVTMLPCTVFAVKDNEKPQYISSIEEAGAIMRAAMVDREKEITIYYDIPQTNAFDQNLINALTKSIYNEAVKHTGNPKEGDALAYVTNGYKVSAAAMGAGNVYKTTLVFYMTYYTDVNQEKKLDQAVEELKKTLHIDDASDVEKIKAIHDYMVTHISYDINGRDNKKDMICHTAYAALTKGKAVCQGYATLFYRLALEYGIDARIISGQSLGDNHGWNIVKIGNVYYNIDTTWDSTTKTNKYFLKSEKDFADHKRDTEHSTAVFTKAYPMSKKSYPLDCSKHEGVEKTTPATLSENGEVVTTCKLCNAVIKTETIKKIDTIKLSYKTCTYSNAVKNPKIIVTDSAKKTISASNYKVTKATGRKAVGTYTYKITFNGKRYSGSQKLTLTINPKNTKIKAVTGAKKAFTVKWNAVSSQATGYQVQYASNKNCTVNKHTVKVKGIKTSSKKITGLKAKKTYYVRVRTYKTVSGKTYYSDWTAPKLVKTK